MFALPCSYAPKHAAPREPLTLETRSVLAVGLAAAMLPLGAAPALADGDTPATVGSSTAATGTADTGTSGTSDGGTSEAAPSDAGSSDAGSAGTAAEPAPAPSEVPAAAPPSSAYEVGPTASSSPSSPPARTAQRKASTSLSFSAPSSARTTKVPVGIRLLANGRGVRNGYVRLEKSTSSGWTYVGRLLTNDEGVGKGTLKVSGGAKLRAAYTGSQVRTPAVSSARTVRAADDSSSAVLREAARHVGKPYRYGAVGPDAFDCSGFTRYVYAQFGKSLPHNARAQEDQATPVSKAEARPGDLVFIQDVRGHVGIYAGDGKMYDAPRSGKTVTLRSIWTSNYTLGRV
ncbi:MAG: hypothetical protein JWO60_2555 [Frankiales bacterium]|nr:hypothetical protein [Frankiales bacterium]